MSDEYWASQIKDIIDGMIINLNKLDSRICMLEKECEQLLEESKEFEAIRFDANLIKDIIEKEVNGK
jgi:hypothetical protein